MTLKMDHRIPNSTYYLSEVTEADKDSFIEYLNDKDVYQNTLSLPYPYTMKDADSWIDFVQQEKKTKGYCAYWAIRREDGKFIGSISFKDFIYGESFSTELGYWIGKPYWGQGIMKSVILTITDYGFAELGIVRFTATIFSFNQRSASVVVKSGFEREGYHRSCYRKNGQYLDAITYAKITQKE